jgi:fructokinase
MTQLDPRMPPRAPRLTVIGEALIDLVPAGGEDLYQAKPGGSGFNVAISLARLGHRTSLMARLGDGAFGRALRAHALAEGVDLEHAARAAEPATMAVVTLDAERSASYEFYLQGTADWQWSDAEIARIPPHTTIAHLGSLVSWTPPGDARLHQAVAGLHRDASVVISYDPNVRPASLGDPELAQPLVERFVAVAHLVKASREDTDWLYPGSAPQDAARRWLDLGALVVVITDGPHGASLFRAGSAPVRRPGRAVRVADTIGAGDAFTAGLLGGLSRRGLRTPGQLAQWPSAGLAEVVEEAVLISALTCERVGADPPSARGGTPRDPSAPLRAADLSFT